MLIPKKHLCLLSFSIFSLASAMDSLIFEDANFKASSLRFHALKPRTTDFEQLEFLGDRVLGLIAAHMLYKVPSLQERNIGTIAKLYEKLVSKPILARMYDDLNIDPAELSSSSYCTPINSPISEKTASDIIEALIGALYKTKGFDNIQTSLKIFIERYLNFDEKILNESSNSTPIVLSSIMQLHLISPPKNIEVLQEALEYQFKDYCLLYEAFKHPSMGGITFKKLDFLGVRVLALVIADHVFIHYHGEGEGLLMQRFEEIVNNGNLEKIFQTWQLGKYLRVQIGGVGISNRIAANTVRTLISAVYLDGGWASAHTVACKLLFSNPPPYVEESNLIRITKGPSFLNDFFENKMEEAMYDTEEKDFITLLDKQEVITDGRLTSSQVSTSYFPPLRLEKQSIPTKVHRGLRPDSGHKEIVSLKKESVWQSIDHSLVKQSGDTLKNAEKLQQLQTVKKEKHTTHVQRQLWPDLTNKKQTTSSNTSVWQKVNDSSVKQTEKKSNIGNCSGNHSSFPPFHS